MTLVGNTLTLDDLQALAAKYKLDRPRWSTLNPPIVEFDLLGSWVKVDEPTSLFLRLRFRFERFLCAHKILTFWKHLPHQRFVPDPNAYLIDGIGFVMHPNTANRLRTLLTLRQDASYHSISVYSRV